jgi:DNA repair protein REV1
MLVWTVNVHTMNVRTTCAEPPADELRRMMQQHGGSYDAHPTSSTTHVIASNLARSKLDKLRTGADRSIVVRPEWICDR